MFINNTIVNNFIPSALLRNVLKGKYLTPRSAFKPMHLIINQGINLIDEIIRISFKVLSRQVKRDSHFYNICHSNVVGDKENGIDEGKEGIIDINFLHIFLSKPRKIFETTPSLFITTVFHGRKIDHYYGDEMKDDNIILVKLKCASGIRDTYTVYLHTDCKDLIDHPYFIVNPDRYGNVELKERAQHE